MLPHSKKIGTAGLLTVLIVFVLIADSCKKSGFGVAEGNLVVANTNTPLANVGIDLCESGPGNGFESVKHTTTDEQGNFRIKYYEHQNKIYSLRVFADGVWDDKKPQIYLDSKKSSRTWEVPMKGFIKIRIQNNRPTEVGVTVSIAGTFLNPVFVGGEQSVTMNEVTPVIIGQPTLVRFFQTGSSPLIPLGSDSLVTVTNKLETVLLTPVIK